MNKPLNIILTTLVYDYSNIGSSLVVYIFHIGIISFVLCGYDVQMNMLLFSLHVCKWKTNFDKRWL